MESAKLPIRPLAARAYRPTEGDVSVRDAASITTWLTETGESTSSVRAGRARVPFRAREPSREPPSGAPSRKRSARGRSARPLTLTDTSRALSARRFFPAVTRPPPEIRADPTLASSFRMESWAALPPASSVAVGTSTPQARTPSARRLA